MRRIEFEAADGWPLAGTLFEGPNDGPAVLLSGAAAVPHPFYARFAKWLCGHGARAVLTYDYRGIHASAGEPARWRELRMADWGLLDMPAALDVLQREVPGVEIVGLGHSYGGQAIGFCGRPEDFTRYATVATMSGYWRGLKDARRVWFLTQVLGRTVAKVSGRVPSWLGVGATMPGGVFLDWARWIATPDYFFSDPTVPTERFAKVTLPYLTVGALDDPWANPNATLDLMRRFEEADVREHWIDANEGIGHLGYFRRKHEAHWPLVGDFVLRGDWKAARPLGTMAGR